LLAFILKEEACVGACALLRLTNITHQKIKDRNLQFWLSF